MGRRVIDVRDTIRDIIENDKRWAKMLFEKVAKPAENNILLFSDEMLNSPNQKPIDLGVDLLLPIDGGAILRIHIIDPSNGPLAFLSLLAALEMEVSRITKQFERQLLKGKTDDIVIEIPWFFKSGLLRWVFKAIETRPISYAEWVNPGYLSSILNDSEAMRRLSPTEYVSIGLMMEFVYDGKQPINNMYRAIYSKISRMRIPKCKREPALDEPPPARLPPSAHLYTYVCHEERDNKKDEALLTMIISSDNMLHTFLMKVDGAKFVVTDILHEMDGVFTNQMLNLTSPFPIGFGIMMNPIFWTVNKSIKGD